MQYIASIDVWTRFQDIVCSVVTECDERLYSGFFPWLMQYINTKYSVGSPSYLPRYLAYYHPSLQNLPIIFISEEDFNGSEYSKAIVIPRQGFHFRPSYSMMRRGFDLNEIEISPEENNFNWEIDYSNEESRETEILIPPKNEFCYSSDFDEEIIRLVNEEDSDKEGEPRERGHYVKSDWLGLYYPYNSSRPRYIYIRVEKILGIKELSNQIGVLSVLLHEIGHAIMDSPNYYPKSHLDELCFYANDEALANAFAYRTLCTARLNKRNPLMDGIRIFMNSQPFVYALGLQFAMVQDSDFVLKSYITNFCKAKYTCELNQPRTWFWKVNKRFWPSFDRYYIKDLINTVFP